MPRWLKTASRLLTRIRNLRTIQFHVGAPRHVVNYKLVDKHMHTRVLPTEWALERKVDRGGKSLRKALHSEANLELLGARIRREGERSRGRLWTALIRKKSSVLYCLCTLMSLGRGKSDLSCGEKKRRYTELITSHRAQSEHVEIEKAGERASKRKKETEIEIQ